MKRIFYIFILLIGINFTSLAQNKIAAQGDGDAKIVKKLYPVPATTVVTFDFAQGYDKSLSFQIYNFTGKVVYEIKNPSQSLTVSLNDFSRGFYYYRLLDVSGRVVETSRFLVVK